MNRLLDVVAGSQASARRSERAVALGPVHLSYLRPATWQRAHGDAEALEGWNIAAFSQLNFRVGMDQYSHPEPSSYIFSASLMLSGGPEDPAIPWRELYFWSWADEYSMHEQQDAARLLSSYNGPMLSNGWQFAHGPFVIDGKDERAFHDRWLALFAKAAQR